VTAVPQQLIYQFLRPPNRRFTFTADLLSAGDRRLVLRSKLYPSKPLSIEGREVLNVGYTADWFLFKDAWFEIGRFYQSDGTWTGYYVNICEPVHWDDADPTTLEPLVDLFLDLWITPEGVPYILDEDEFQEAVAAGHLTPRKADSARTTLDELLAATRRGDFPPPEVKDFPVP
jgi:predicted RNA-binding protein associated with RNAse of E/G family